jgi:hypothetical protein
MIVRTKKRIRWCWVQNPNYLGLPQIHFHFSLQRWTSLQLPQFIFTHSLSFTLCLRNKLKTKKTHQWSISPTFHAHICANILAQKCSNLRCKFKKASCENRPRKMLVKLLLLLLLHSVLVKNPKLKKNSVKIETFTGDLI